MGVQDGGEGKEENILSLREADMEAVEEKYKTDEFNRNYDTYI